VRSKQQSSQERGKDREYNVTRDVHISTQWYAVTVRLSLPVHIEHHHKCSSVGKRNTFWVGDSVGETWLWCLTLVSELYQAHNSTAFLSSTKALAHDTIRFCHCAAVLQTQVPELCTDLDLSFRYILSLGTYSKFAQKNNFLALGVCFPQPCSSAGCRFAASRSRVQNYQQIVPFVQQEFRWNTL